MRYCRELLLNTLQNIVQIYHVIPGNTRRLKKHVNQPVAIEYGTWRVVGRAWESVRAGEVIVVGGRARSTVAPGPALASRSRSCKQGSRSSAAAAEQNYVRSTKKAGK